MKIYCSSFFYVKSTTKIGKERRYRRLVRMTKATSKGPAKGKGRPPGKKGEGSKDRDNVPDEE